MTNKNIAFRKIISSESFKSISSAILCALSGILVGFIILAIINAEHAPKAMATILKNFFYYKKTNMKLFYLGSTLVKSVPLILCALSVLFAYKSGLFNIGVGGQYCLGIGITLWCALQWNLPWFVCILMAVIVSALWGAISGVLKAFFNVNEVIACIMMNWISLYIVNIMMQKESIMDVSKSETFAITARSPASLLPKLGLDRLFSNNQYVTIAIPLTIIIAVLIWVVLNKTTFGYELKATGLNKNAAKYAGMKDKCNIIITMAIAGALAGLAASLFYLTDMQPWKTSSTVPAMGFNGIAVTFLGGLNPIGVLVAGYFIQHITFGGSLIDMHYYNPQIADLISSIIIYACGFVLFFKDMMAKIASHKKEDK
ncbi:MAG: ABC transporter permease [Treponema sp.]|nr:ABC transporter permease [Spirochaetia bacterium]MDD7459680.1 ABC transporter permease [Spirochaetales bacterium]MDY5811672.1 ABC transporter permease [Treponema sp.]MEE1182809.1 ABC transporter permease [Treponema sp.]